MGQATVFENAWPKASDLPQYNPTCHFVQSTQSLPTCTLLYASVSRQILRAPHLSCPWYHGTNRQQQRNWVLGKRNECVSSFLQAFVREQRCWVHRQRFTLHGKALLWERRAGRRHCMYCKGPHSWKQGKRSKQPLQSRLFTSLFVCSFGLKCLSRFTQVSALKKWANWIWALGQLAAASKEQKAVLIPWIGWQSIACTPWSFPPQPFCRAARQPGGNTHQICHCPSHHPQLPSHMQGMGNC